MIFSLLFLLFEQSKEAEMLKKLEEEYKKDIPEGK